MGICFSNNAFNKNNNYASNDLNTFCSEHLLAYPGSKVFLSIIAVRWIWQEDIDGIISYMEEEDPLKIRKTYMSIKRTLDCVARYRRHIHKPFLHGIEHDRYKQFIDARQSGQFNGFVVADLPIDTTIEYLKDCSLIGFHINGVSK